MRPRVVRLIGYSYLAHAATVGTSATLVQPLPLGLDLVLEVTKIRTEMASEHMRVRLMSHPKTHSFISTVTRFIARVLNSLDSLS